MSHSDLDQRCFTHRGQYDVKTELNWKKPLQPRPISHSLLMPPTLADTLQLQQLPPITSTHADTLDVLVTCNACFNTSLSH